MNKSREVSGNGQNLGAACISQEGAGIMCKEMDQIYREGETRGEMKKAFETAITLFEIGEPVERIAQAVKVSTELVQEWLSGNGNLENLNVQFFQA